MTETDGSEAVSPLTLESARALLEEHIARLNAAQYQIGRIFNEVLDRGLAGGTSYTAMLRHFGPAVRALAVRDVRRARAAARRFPEAAFVKYGVRRLGLLAQYGQRCRREWMEGEPGHMLLKVPCEDGYLRQKPFPECTPEEVGRAIVREQQGQGTPIPRLEEYCIHLLREGIRNRLPDDSAVTVKARMRDGEVLVTLKDIPFAELKRVAQAIPASLVPLERETWRRTLAPRPRPAPDAAPGLHGLPVASAGYSGSLATWDRQVVLRGT